MSDTEITKALALLDFLEGSDTLTETLRRYRWALREVVRLRAALAALETRAA